MGSAFPVIEASFGGKADEVSFTYDVYLRLIKDGIKAHCDIIKYNRDTKTRTTLQTIDLTNKSDVYLGRFEQAPRMYYIFDCLTDIPRTNKEKFFKIEAFVVK